MGTDEDDASMSSDDEEYRPENESDGDAGEAEGKKQKAGGKKQLKEGGSFPAGRKGRSKELQLEDDEDEEHEEETLEKSDSKDRTEKAEDGPGMPSPKRGQSANTGGQVSSELEKSLVPETERDSEQDAPAKSKIDDIWASMNSLKTVKKKAKPVGFDASWLNTTSLRVDKKPSVAQVNVDPAEKPAEKSNVQVNGSSLTSTSEKINEELGKKQESGSTESAMSAAEKGKRQNPKGEGNLSSIVAELKGKKSSVIDRSRDDWRVYKEENKVEDELNAHKKDKGRYTDKVAFLERVEHREWESEQARKKRR